MAVRRVRRVVRKFDPWTVLKVSLLFHAVTTLAMLLGAVILWSVMINVGIPNALDSFLEGITLLEADLSFFNNGQQYFRVALFFGVIWTVAMTVVTTLAALLYNLISDVVGGVEVVLLEETLRIQHPNTAGGVRPPLGWDQPSPDQADLPTQQQPAITEEISMPPPAALPSPDEVQFLEDDAVVEVTEALAPTDQS